MKTEIKALEKQTQDASDGFKGTISELLLRVEAGMPPEELVQVKKQLLALQKRINSKIVRGTERMGLPEGLLPA